MGLSKNARSLMQINLDRPRLSMRDLNSQTPVTNAAYEVGIELETPDAQGNGQDPFS